MIPRQRDRGRWLLSVVAGAAAFLMAESRPATAGSAEECRTFHQECMDARAVGARDVGICRVERLECPADRDAGVTKPSHDARDDDGQEREHVVGERSVGR